MYRKTYVDKEIYYKCQIGQGLVGEEVLTIVKKNAIPHCLGME